MNANVQQNQPQLDRHGNIIFRVGTMLHFISTRTFALGDTGITVRNGADIFYDGTKAEYDGAEFTVRFLRGAIKERWLVLAHEYDESDPSYGQRTSANIQVRHPTNGGNPMNPQRTQLATTETDEREVQNVVRHAETTRTANANFRRGVNVVQPGTPVRTQHGMMVVEEQDGVEVPGRRMQTPAGEAAKQSKANLEHGAGELLRQAAAIQIQPGRGVTQEEMLERMTPEEQEQYLSEKEARRGQYVNEAPKPTRRTVGRVASQTQGESSGMRFSNSFGGGTEISDGDGEVVAQIADQVNVVEQEGMRFTNTTRKKPPVARLQPVEEPVDYFSPIPKDTVSAETRLKLAKAICPDFPDNYDFALPTKKKLARITADYEERHDVLRAIFAAENDEMKALLVQEFPAAFG